MALVSVSQRRHCLCLRGLEPVPISSKNPLKRILLNQKSRGGLRKRRGGFPHLAEIFWQNRVLLVWYHVLLGGGGGAQDGAQDRLISVLSYVCQVFVELIRVKIG